MSIYLTYINDNNETVRPLLRKESVTGYDLSQGVLSVFIRKELPGEPAKPKKNAKGEPVPQKERIQTWSICRTVSSITNYTEIIEFLKTICTPSGQPQPSKQDQTKMNL